MYVLICIPIEGKIFVGGLSWQTTEASLRIYFERFGELSDAAIMIDKRTGQPRYITRLLSIYIVLIVLLICICLLLCIL